MKYYINYHASIDMVFIGPVSTYACADEATVFTLADDMRQGLSSSCPVEGARDLLESDREWIGRGIPGEIRKRLVNLIADSYLPMRNGSWAIDKQQNRGDA